MDTVQGLPPPSKKRRIPKACAACHRSKLKCDERRPCTRCVQSSTTCVWHEKIQDPVAERFERIEHTIRALNERIDVRDTPIAAFTGSEFVRPQDTVVEHTAVDETWTLTCGIFSVRQPAIRDVIASGVVLESDAQMWFAFFMAGCNRFVPVFDPKRDTFDNVRRRSTVLFDVLVTIGCMAANGSLSKAFLSLYQVVKQHTSDLTLHDSGHCLESVQALLVIASYSDSGATILDTAIRASLRLRLPETVTLAYTSIVQGKDAGPRTEESSTEQYASTRTWHGLVLLDQILSLDGGKARSVTVAVPRRVRALLSHPHCSMLDLRLFAQVELNELRASCHAAVAASANGGEQALHQTINGCLLDLSMWHSEWEALINRNVSGDIENTVFVVNLRIQHAWAVLTLQLRALAASGVENLAVMTDAQRALAFAAKLAAERHLELLLTSTPAAPSPGAPEESTTCLRPYASNFRFAMEFVWAKNVFCVLIVLRLAILLGDPVSTLSRRLQQTQDFLDELKKVGKGANMHYTRILTQIAEKCQRAVEGSVEASADLLQESSIPHEFLLGWNFPGLNLCYLPLDWQDLFLDFDPVD
ncbi:hypothetical protein LTR56_022742 [Elasticomyces elasticus]|nr:hypothetical protein LTR56_022742 [Elasticomyces elasticus]KAK3627804.1 hypothetical protein LTR22_022576 [Elasticomyces elasticus]KAK4907900.1 hypothetical protein LTR49_023103 [Elasticomyces elasticus]KAK5748028.1 hypothetical protein LTS12_021888 [Elasticomyces elasticus]